MRPRINQHRRNAGVVALAMGLVVLVGGLPAAAGEGPVAMPIDDHDLGELLGAPLPDPSDGGERHPKIAAALMEVIGAHRGIGDWRSVATDRGMLTEGDAVLVEMRLDAGGAESTVWDLERLGGRVRHHNVPSLLEIWLPVAAVEAAADRSGVLAVRPARIVRTTAGSMTSEGVSALNVNTAAVDYDYHDLGADGSGVTIASIDAGYENYASLQASGDWPQPANLRRFEVDGGPVTDCDAATCSDYEASDHGAATMQLVFDVAPGADYLTYRTTTVGDWYTALVHAADNGADIVTVSLSAPLDNVGDGGQCPAIWPAPCGTIAEAAAYARSQGVLVVNSAGNYRTEHWGGPYVDASGYLDWGSGGNVNIGGIQGVSYYCYPTGYPMNLDLFWDDWTAVTRDYDLLLLEWHGRFGWVVRAESTATQDGGAGQTPQEAIRYTVTRPYGRTHSYCDSDYGLFGIAVSDEGGGAGGNLQLFASNWADLWNWHPERSLGFPADSPDVFAVGAVDVATPGTLEDYSAEGPVLGPGGTQAAPDPANPKPDGVSVSGVSIVDSTGATATFGGTSSSAPHTAGIAAILTQLRNEKYATPPATNNPDGMHNLLSTFAIEDPTFPAVHDTTYGHGLVKLRFCDESVAVSDGEWIMLGLPCVRRDAATVAEVLGDDLDLANVYWEVWEQGETLGSYIQLFEGDLMVPGEGYWLLYEGNATVDIQGLVQDRSESYRYALKGEASALGWANFLGHPFETAVDWPDVTVFYGGAEHSLADAIDDGVMRNFMWGPYTATGYVENDGTLGEGTMSSFDGFWVKAFEDTELRVPAALAAGGAAGPILGNRSKGWTVKLEATMLGITAAARLGQLEDSAQGWDLHDAEYMGSFEQHRFAVVMPHDGWGELAGDYVRDYRRRRKVETWEIEVRSNLGGEVTLRWQGPARRLQRSVLVDLDGGVSLPAAKLQSEGYVFTMDPGVRHFEWRLQ